MNSPLSLLPQISMAELTDPEKPLLHHHHAHLKLHRCKTAPAMAVLRHTPSPSPSPPLTPSSPIIKHAAVFLLLYLSFGVFVYALNPDKFSGAETHPMVDAFYFSIVTLCTIGYGDIAPSTPATKLFACAFVLVGFGFIDILLSGAVNHVLDLQEQTIINSKSLLVDVEKGRMRIRLKLGLAIVVVVFCIGIGTVIFRFVEGLEWVDSFYLAAISVTTVGYGDRAFRTMVGRMMAGVWLLVSTLAVARAFLYLAEARVDKRQRMIAKWVLQREVTAHDILSANINNHDFISKSEYVIYKLKEMGKIEEKDVLDICKQFSRLDPNGVGKLTLPEFLRNHM